MTEPQRNTPLTADDVKLLREGDYLHHAIEGVMVFSCLGDYGGVICTTEDGSTWTDYPDALRFLARPADPNDPEGWIKHDGGPNPAPGLAVDWKSVPNGSWGQGGPADALPWSFITHWRPHVPARGGEEPCPKRGEIRVINGQRCRFIERELEGDKWEVLGPDAPPQPKGEVEAAVVNLADEVHAWSEGNAGHDVGPNYHVTDFLTLGDLRTLLSALTASQEREARAVEALLLFRRFVQLNTGQWAVGAGSHHHPIWAHVAEALGEQNDSDVTSPEWRFIQPENDAALATLKEQTK